MTGTGKLIRLILRRDRVILPLWVLLFGLLPAIYISSIEGIFPTDAERLTYARVSTSNTGFVALYGLLHGDSYAVLANWRAGFLPVMIGLAALLTVVRHTRADEEAGRTELIGATVVGRHAQLAAAVLTTAVAGLVVGLIIFATTSGFTKEGATAAGSLAFGAELTCSVWVFTAVAAITAQLTSSARSARAIAVVVLGVAYALRVGGDMSAMGDGSVSWLSWISPIGWMTHIFPYAAVANWWPVVLAVLFSAVAGAVAVVLRGRRDLGDGVFAARLGRAAATPSLRTPLALAWRMHRGLLLGWTFGLALLGLIFGGVGGSVLDLAQDNESLKNIFGRMGGSGTDQLIDSYFASTAGMVGLVAACYAVQATLRLRDEETTGHAEAVLTTAVSRVGWAASHLLFALLGPALALFAEGLTSGLTYTQGDLGDIVGGVMMQLPAVWVLAAVTMLLFGLLPRWSPAAWAAPVICLLVLLLGQELQLNQWLLDVSPFTHVPHLPGDIAVLPLVNLTGVAIVVAAAGLVGLRRRNIPD
jgi:ABC-2 type transport system permease protein